MAKHDEKLSVFTDPELVDKLRERKLQIGTAHTSRRSPVLTALTPMPLMYHCTNRIAMAAQHAL